MGLPHEIFSKKIYGKSGMIGECFTTYGGDCFMAHIILSGHFLLALLIGVFTISQTASANEDLLVYIISCDAGSWYGDRIEYSGLTYEHMLKDKERNYFSSMKDRYSSPAVKYIIPYDSVSNAGIFDDNKNASALYIYGEKTTIAFVMNRYNHYVQGENISITYNMNNLAYLDTIFIDSGLVYSSIHKTNAKIQVAATYTNKCFVSGPKELPPSIENYHVVKQFLTAQ